MSYINDLTNKETVYFDIAKMRATLEAEVATFNQPIILEPFTINGTTYKYIENTEKFITDKNTEVTINALLTAEYSEYKSYYEKLYQLPQKLLMFSESTRRRIIRVAQLYNREPPVTANVIFLTPIFDYLSKYAENVYSFSQQYKSCLWACDNNAELATALYLYYGNVQQLKINNVRIPMAGTSIHTLTKTADGVHIEIHYNHTVQNRLDAACAEISAYYSREKQYNELLNINRLKAIGFKEFYYHSNSYISISNSYHQYIQAKINEFIDNLVNAIDNKEPKYPTVTEPNDFIPNDKFIIGFDELLFSELSAAQENRVEQTAKYKVKEILQEKLPREKFNTDTPYPRKELIKYVNDKNLIAGVTHKYLSKPKYGYYQINKNLYEE